MIWNNKYLCVFLCGFGGNISPQSRFFFFFLHSPHRNEAIWQQKVRKLKQEKKKAAFSDSFSSKFLGDKNSRKLLISSLIVTDSRAPSSTRSTQNRTDSVLNKTIHRHFSPISTTQNPYALLVIGQNTRILSFR